MNEQQGNKKNGSRWISPIVGIILLLLGAGATYGIVLADTGQLKKDVTSLKRDFSDLKQEIPQIRDRLTRIEVKLESIKDRLLEVNR